MNLSDFDFPLPPELIAQHPAHTRTASRLLHVNGQNLADRGFSEFLALVKPNDILVFNDTKVIKARLHGHKETGGTAEVLIERVLISGNESMHDSLRALAHVRASKSPKPGTRILFAEGISARMVVRAEDLFELHFEGAASVFQALEKIGEVPLPPYITHQAEGDDESRYQTVYAKHQGSVAAPTAGLHFDEPMLQALTDKGATLAYVTLHVGAGTFRPVRDDDIAKHVMHSERYDVPAETVAAIAQAKAKGGDVIAVGTTSTRTLEAASRDGTLRAGSGETQIFITPGFQFNTVDRMLTNFHLPKSTLLMLVSAFAGYENIMHAYKHAVDSKYRFFSYGDAMFLERARN
jgi:S-adenosylmethionine:tRNA ribosyltransferase-isomerase